MEIGWQVTEELFIFRWKKKKIKYFKYFEYFKHSIFVEIKDPQSVALYKESAFSPSLLSYFRTSFFFFFFFSFFPSSSSFSFKN